MSRHTRIGLQAGQPGDWLACIGTWALTAKSDKNTRMWWEPVKSVNHPDGQAPHLSTSLPAAAQAVMTATSNAKKSDAEVVAAQCPELWSPKQGQATPQRAAAKALDDAKTLGYDDWLALLDRGGGRRTSATNGSSLFDWRWRTAPAAYGKATTRQRSMLSGIAWLAWVGVSQIGPLDCFQPALFVWSEPVPFDRWQYVFRLSPSWGSLRLERQRRESDHHFGALKPSSGGWLYHEPINVAQAMMDMELGGAYERSEDS